MGSDDATGAGVVDAFLAVNRVDVWLRDNENDRGLVPARGINWLSPDIKVLAAPLADPDADFDAASHIDRPEFGNPHYAYIKARNRGVLPASNVSVGFFYADPSTYISYPADWKDGQSGIPEQGTVTVDGLSTNQFLIPTIPAKDARVAGPYLWQPPAPASATQTATDSDGRTRGHFCLLTRLECDADPITYVGGGWPAVSGDNNIGMKNVWVVEPEVVFPLCIGKLPRKLGVLSSRIKVEVDDPLESIRFEIRMPKRAVQLDVLRKAEVAFRESKQQKSMLYLLFGGRRGEWLFDVPSQERLPLLCVAQYDKRRRPRTEARRRPREARVNIYQFGGDILLGGVTVRVPYPAAFRKARAGGAHTTKV